MATLGSLSGISGYTGIYHSVDDEPEYRYSTMVFQQSTAPVGWTKIPDIGDLALRVVSGNSGAYLNINSIGFNGAYSTSSFTPYTWTVPGTLGTTTLTTANMGSHTHHIKDINYTAFRTAYPGNPSNTIPFRSVNSYFSPTAASPYIGSTVSQTTGTSTDPSGGLGHNHTTTVDKTLNFPGSMTRTIKYVDAIIARRNLV